MPRTIRKTLGGCLYHVLNRANGRLKIFKKRDDFLAFERILGQAQERFDMRICGYCLMGNHWHLLLWPRSDGDLSAFMQWLTVTHTMRYHSSHGTAGMGHIYQGRYKSFPVQEGTHYQNVLRYIEANSIRAKLVAAADEFEWSSYRFHTGQPQEEKQLMISHGPQELPENWPSLVNKAMPKSDVADICNSIKRGAPLGDDQWRLQIAAELNLQSTLNPRGRPKKEV